jgi:tRNA(Ile)-lysidine synthetase-like protein
VDENIIKVFQYKKIPDEIILINSDSIINSKNFIVKKKNQIGLCFSAIQNLKLIFSVRRGGEFFIYNKKKTYLKKFLYDKKVPKWQSDFLVIIYLNNEIIYIEDYFIDNNYLADKYDDSINFTVQH